MAVIRYPAETDAPLHEFIAIGLREGNRYLLQSEPVAAFLRRPDYAQAAPTLMAKAVRVINLILRYPQEVKGLRAWRGMTRFAIAALYLNDHYTLNAIAHCAEMGIACTEEEKLTQIMLMCLGQRALPEQVLIWSESCFDTEPMASSVGLCYAGQIAHLNRDKGTLKAILGSLEKLVQTSFRSPKDIADDILEIKLLASRYDDLCSKPSIEALCEYIQGMNPFIREKYCREICTAFPQHTSSQKCAICAKRYSGCRIIRE
jgi:hypothetical protein